MNKFIVYYEQANNNTYDLEKVVFQLLAVEPVMPYLFQSVAAVFEKKTVGIYSISMVVANDDIVIY